MDRKYKNPPLIEALCGIQFEPDASWDLAIPGLVYEEVKKDFPKRRPVKVIEGNLTADQEGVKQQMRTTERIQFLRDDRKVLIQVGPNFLSVNHLKPYSTWVEFLPLIQQGFDVYRRIAKPKGIQNIGLRYINRIEIPVQEIKIEDYLQFYPFLGKQLPQEHGPFIAGIQLSHQNSRDILKMELANAEVDRPGLIAMILDLDYSLAQSRKITFDNVLEWIQIAHQHIKDTFEACLTDRLRQIFEQEKE